MKVSAEHFPTFRTSEVAFKPSETFLIPKRPELMSPIPWNPPWNLSSAPKSFPNTSGTFRYLQNLHNPAQAFQIPPEPLEPQAFKILSNISGTQLVLVCPLLYSPVSLSDVVRPPVIPRLLWRIALDVVEAQAIPLPEYHPSPNHADVFRPQKESPFQLSVYFSCLLAKHWKSHICKTCDTTRCASLPGEAPSFSRKTISWQIQLLWRCLCFPQGLVAYLTPSQQKS